MQNEHSTQIQAHIEHLNRVLRAIRNVNQLIVREKDRGRLIQRACELLVETRGFYGAWIVLTAEPPARALAAQAGLPEVAFAALLQRVERGELPSCGHRAQAAGAAVLTENTPTACADCPLAQAYAGASALTACLTHEGRTYGFLGVSVPARFADDEEERQMLQEIAGDLAFALHDMALEAQRRQSAEALRESQSQFQTLFESNPLAIAVHTADGRFLRCNQATIDLLGYSASELATLDPTFPDDQDAGRDLYERLAAGDLDRYQREKRYLCRDGRVIWAQLTVTQASNADGAPEYLMFIIQDITERKRAEEELYQEHSLLLSLMNNVPDHIYFKDTNSRFIRISRSMGSLFGLNDPAEAMGKTDFDFFAEDHAQKAFADEQQVMQTGQPLVGIEEKETWPGGRETWVSTVKMPLRDARGDIVGTFGISRDITERRQAEEQIRFQAQLLSSVRESIVATDLKGHITYWSQGAKELYGYLPEEMTGKPITLVVAPGDQQEENERIRQTLERGTWRGQYIQRRKDGASFWADTVFSLMRDAHGQVCGLISIDRDLTELRRVVDELKESNRLLENGRRFITHILESIPSSMLVMDQNLRIISANRNFSEKTHQDERTILGRQLEEVFPQVLFEYARLKQKAQNVFRTGRMLEGERVAYRAPGLPSRIYYYRLIPLKAGNVVENVMLLMDDITEQQKLEEEVQRIERHLASVVECANDIVISMDSAGKIVTWNQAAEGLSGLKSEQVRGHSLVSFCTGRQQAMMTDILRELARGQIVQHAEVDLLTVDDREVPIAWSFSLMRGDSGKVVGLVAVGRDLTLRRQLEIQLIQSAKVASLGVMAGGIAHELRNPLGIISASVQLIRDYPDDVDLRNQAVEKTYAATQRASLIIENLLKFARSQDMQMTQINVRTVLDDTLVLLNPQLKLNNIQMRKEFCNNPCKMYGNPELLQQVFANLILNACSAMPDGGALTILTQIVKTGMMEIKLIDTGVGIPQSHLSKIFDPFFTTMPVGQGVGLGLSISYSIIQRHQGVIDVESQVGKGTTFIIRLPISG